MIISHIVAAGINNEIGKDNTLLWRMPNDMKFFINTTKGHCVLMGRKTFESFGKKLLKNRTNIVITRQNYYKAEGCVVVGSVAEGIEYAREHHEDELFIIGGGGIYEQSLEKTDKVYLTRIYSEFEAEVFYPKLETNDWQKISEEPCQKDERHAYDYTFFVYQRKN